MTIKQRQCLLFYLGYYVGEVDGKWGTLSMTATKAFQKDFGGLEVDGICGAKTEKALTHAVAYGMPARKETLDWWNDIQYFDRDDFKCKCGGKYCNGYPAEMKEKVVRIADGARKHFGAKAHVISGLRCKTHNANEEGASNSRHLSGKAIDLRVEGVSADNLLAYVQKQGIRYAYKINSTNVHFDIE
jgi:hypothetical protein